MSLIKKFRLVLSFKNDSGFYKFFNDSFHESNTTFNPRVDIAETEKGFEIDLAVPGFDKKSFEVI